MRRRSSPTGRAVTVLAVALALAVPAALAGAKGRIDPNLVDAFAHLNFTQADSQQIIDRSWSVSDPAMFRYAAALDAPSITPEEAPWAVPTRIGLTWVSWPADQVPTFPSSAQIVNNALYLPHNGPIADTEYALMWAQMGGPVPIQDPMEFWHNSSFPIGIPGEPTWNPFSSFPYDTWGGASVIPYLTYGPQPWSLNLSVVQQDGSLADIDFSGFGLIANDMIIIAVDVDSLLPNGPEGLTYSFAFHTHDGGYGASPSSKSLVTFATGTPGNLLPYVPGGLLVVGSTPTPEPTTTTTVPTTTTTTLGTAPPDDDTTVGAAGDTAGDTTTSGGLPGWVVAFLAALGLTVAVIGGRLYILSKKDPCEEYLSAWQKAQSDCDEAGKKEKEAKEDCDEAAEKRKDLERKHRNLCAEWPPACEGEGSSAEASGDPDSRVTSRDLHARRIALGRLWDEYQAGNVDAPTVEDAWERANTREFRDEMRKKTEEKTAEREQLEKDTDAAKDAEKEACDKHAKAKAAAEKACDEAEKAKKAYDDCVKEENAEAFVDALMTLGSDGDAAGTPEPSADTAGAAVETPAPSSAATAPTEDPLAGRKVGVSVPFSIDTTGMSANEAERTRRLERIFSMRKGTCEIDKVAKDLYQFNHWNQETFGEPWFTWSTDGNNPNAVTSTSGTADRFIQTRVMACYEFVHFCAYICSDQLGRQRIGGDDDDNPVLLDEYSIDWGFADEINTNTSPIGDEGAPAGSVVTGVFRWGDYNNTAGYYHTGISIGDGKVISLGSDGLLMEDTTGAVSAAFPSVGYSEVNVGDYAYGNQNPAPAGK